MAELTRREKRERLLKVLSDGRYYDFMQLEAALGVKTTVQEQDDGKSRLVTEGYSDIIEELTRAGTITNIQSPKQGRSVVFLTDVAADPGTIRRNAQKWMLMTLRNQVLLGDLVENYPNHQEMRDAVVKILFKLQGEDKCRRCGKEQKSFIVEMPGVCGDCLTHAEAQWVKKEQCR